MLKLYNYKITDFHDIGSGYRFMKKRDREMIHDKERENKVMEIWSI